MDEDRIPPLRRPDQMPPIYTQDDLHAYWRALMGPLGFGTRKLWLSFLTADCRTTDLLTQIDDIPTFPDTELLTNLMYVALQVLDNTAPGGSLAVLLSRPGRARVTESDRTWARALTSSAIQTGVAMHPVHLANDTEIRVFAPDDLLRSKSA